MDGVLIFADDGPVFPAWVQSQMTACDARIRDWVDLWRREVSVEA